jgi:3-methylfumaryl-CoA hydratase
MTTMKPEQGRPHRRRVVGAARGRRTLESSMDLNHLRDWVGHSEERTDLITVAPVAALAATLDRDRVETQPGAELPPLWHWLYFTPLARQSEIGADGHAKRGGFLPPVPLPRRMWAGGRLEFLRPLKIGETIKRVSRIIDTNSKEGRSGTLVFVTVAHEISSAAGVAIQEEHDIVYRENPRPDAPAPKPQPAIHRFTVCGRPGADQSVALWARDHEGWLAMEASADLR